MNRKTFLATIAALFTAPFIGKSKEKKPISGFHAGYKQGVQDFITAPAKPLCTHKWKVQYLRGADTDMIKVSQCINCGETSTGPHKPLTIKGKDLRFILDRSESRLKRLG